MNPFAEIKERIIDASSPKKINEFIRQIVIENAEFLEDLNIAQLEQGENIDGSKISPEYTELTKQIKEAKGQPFDRVTLKDEGDLYRSAFVQASEKNFEILFSDSKEPKLREKYGKLWQGLSDQSKQIFVDEVLVPELILRVKKKMQLA